VVLLAAVAALCMVLAETRNWQWIGALQCTLAAYAFLTLLKLPVDMYCFPLALTRDTMSLAFPVVWMAYLAVSARVRRVFPHTEPPSH
jgi:hypothetical protein